MNIILRSVGSYIPEKQVTNKELESMIETSDEWIRSHTGIGSRHIAADHEAASDMGYRAAIQALERASMEISDIDGIITATATPDHPGFPATACIIQDMLKAQPIFAFDITAGCSGFIYALEIARGLITLGKIRSILVIGTEKLTGVVDWTDRNCVLFGDAAGAAVVSAEEDGPHKRGIIDSELYADGSGASALIVAAGGSRKPAKYGFDNLSEVTLRMEGRKVYNFAVGAIVDTLRSLMDRNRLTIDDVSYIVPHQANSRIIHAAAKRMGIPYEKFFMNIETLANTSAASIPLALAEMSESGLLKRGDLILTIGFGAGLTYGGNVIIW